MSTETSAMKIGNFLHNVCSISTLLGTLLLFFENNLALTASTNERKTFKSNLKDFASFADDLAGGLKTVAKVAKVLIGGEVDHGKGECEFVCSNGAVPRRRIGHVPQDNGCGTYGFKVDLSMLPQMEYCCSKHDKCYGQCGMEKGACDVQFSQCLENVCNTLLHTIGLNDQESEGCIMTVQLMYATVLELGCQAYLDGQKEACICQIHPDETGRKAKHRSNMEL